MLACLLVVVGLAVAPSAARAGDRPFGLGIALGAPIGLSAKWYLGRPFALQFLLGTVPEWRDDDDGIHVGVDAVWHPAILARDPAFTLPIYVGVGGRILFEDDDGPGDDDEDIHIGARVPFGILMDFNRVPIDIFFELAIIVDFLEIEDVNDDDDDDLIDLNAVIGIRYYF
jgi:hypothetical protein